jgi:hypothetical protein
MRIFAILEIAYEPLPPRSPEPLAENAEQLFRRLISRNPTANAYVLAAMLERSGPQQIKTEKLRLGAGFDFTKGACDVFIVPDPQLRANGIRRRTKSKPVQTAAYH